MKNLILLITLISVSLTGFSQSDAEYNQETGKVQIQDIIELPDKPANDLYERSMNWIVKTYKNPEYVIAGKIESQMIKGNGAGSDVNIGSIMPDYASMTYEWQIDVKDNKVRYTFDNIRLRSEIGEFGIENYIVKNGEIKDKKVAQRIKSDVEDQANGLIISLREELFSDVQAQSDDW